MNQVDNNGLAIVVKHLGSTKTLNIVKILRRGCDEDLISSCDGELDRITADACRTSPDSISLHVL
jgi:hypothetical protein